MSTTEDVKHTDARASTEPTSKGHREQDDRNTEIQKMNINLKIPSMIEDFLDELKQYSPGKYRQLQHKAAQAKLPHTNIFVVGFTYSGKSTLINTLLAAISRAAYLEIAGVSDSQDSSHTPDYEGYSILESVNIVDSKGIEALSPGAIEQYILDFNEQRLLQWVQHSFSVVTNTAQRRNDGTPLSGYAHFVLIAVPWNQDSTQLTDIKRLMKTLRGMKCPFKVVYTKTDTKVEPGQDADSRPDGLHLLNAKGPERAVKFVNYTQTGEKNAEIEYAALKLLKDCLVGADLQGHRYKPPSKWASSAVGMCTGVKDVLKGKMLLGLLLVVVALLIVQVVKGGPGSV